MKTVTVNYYVAPDGKKFTSKKEALKYEKTYDEVMEVYKTIPKRPDNIEFLNGEGWIQHKPGTYKMFEEKLVKITNKCYNLKGKDAFKGMNYALVRMVNDGDAGILDKMVSRLMCMDNKTEREYGQPYYANNPKEARGTQINK
jgi:hypothetical protein